MARATPRSLAISVVVLVLVTASLLLRRPLASSLLRTAVCTDQLAPARLLLRLGANPNRVGSDGRTALMIAARCGALASLRLLLAYGADPRMSNGDGWTPLFEAAEGGSVDAIKLLVQAGADVNATLPDGRTVFMVAARDGTGDVLEALVHAGAAFDKKDKRGATAKDYFVGSPNEWDAFRTAVESGGSYWVRQRGVIRVAPNSSSLSR